MRSMIDSVEIQALTRFLDVDVFRQGIITSNLANIDTPGYRTRDINFRMELARAAWGEFHPPSGPEVPLQTAFATRDQVPFTPIARRVPGLVERPDGVDLEHHHAGGV